MTCFDVLIPEHRNALDSVGVSCCTGDSNHDFVSYFGEWFHIPILGDAAHLGLLIAGLHFQTATLLTRCPSTRAASVVTSSVTCCRGVAYRSASFRRRPVRVCETRSSSP